MTNLVQFGPMTVTHGTEIQGSEELECEVFWL